MSHFNQPLRYSLLAAYAFVAAARMAARGASTGDSAACAENICGGGADYPVDGTIFYSEFSVPGLPTNLSARSEGTYFIYTNIFFRNPPRPAAGSYGIMNQFVPQLMLGNPLSGSTNWPYYLPQWSQEQSWVFAAQYFFELYNATSGHVEAKAAAGEVFGCAENETLWTSFTRAPRPGAAWTLAMGVKGDAARTSLVVATAPFMGLIPGFSSSWGEDAYVTAHLNSCWELYGVDTRGAYPATGSVFDMRTVQAGPRFPWQTNWRNVEVPTCPGAPTGTFKVSANATQQDVLWTIGWD